MQLIYYSNTLEHHGIKGQRWGVRRYQNADGSLTPLGRGRYGGISNRQFKKERHDLESHYRKISKKNKEMSELEKKAIEIADKYDFDQDDGGNAYTKAAQKAAKKYGDMYDKIEMLYDERDREARAEAAKALEKKYGKETYSNLLKRQDRINKAKGFAVAAGILSVPIAGLAGIAGLAVAERRKS